MEEVEAQNEEPRESETSPTSQEEMPEKTPPISSEKVESSTTQESSPPVSESLSQPESQIQTSRSEAKTPHPTFSMAKPDFRTLMNFND